LSRPRLRKRTGPRIGRRGRGLPIKKSLDTRMGQFANCAKGGVFGKYLLTELLTREGEGRPPHKNKNDRPHSGIGVESGEVQKPVGKTDKKEEPHPKPEVWLGDKE